MIKKSVSEETIIQKIFWQLSTNTLAYISIFALYFVLFQASIGIDLNIIVIYLLVGVILELVFSIFEIRLLKLFLNFLPLVFTFSAILFFHRQEIRIFRDILLIFFGYTFINSIGQALSISDNPIKMALVFFGLQLNKIAWLIIISSLVPRTFPSNELLNVSIANTVLQLEKYFLIYIFVNLIIFILSYIVVVVVLFTRNIYLNSVSRKLERISSWHIDHKIIKEGIENGEFSLKTFERTIVFGDIRGFTPYSEKHSNSEVYQVLFDFYQIVEEMIHKNGGNKPEFIADEFVTFFASKKKAVEFAIDINSKMNNYLAIHGLSFGMGIDSGHVMEGIIGGQDSKKYTVLGSPVNIASRLQAQAKGGQILASKNIVESVKNLEFEKVDGIKLKGIEGDFEVYSISKFSGYKSKRKNMFSKVKEILGKDDNKNYSSWET